jgi:hypothetical protein
MTPSGKGSLFFIARPSVRQRLPLLPFEQPVVRVAPVAQPAALVSSPVQSSVRERFRPPPSERLVVLAVPAAQPVVQPVVLLSSPVQPSVQQRFRLLLSEQPVFAVALPPAVARPSVTTLASEQRSVSDALLLH